MTEESQYSPDYADRPRPEMITLSKGIFAEGSVGYELFPEILEGRRRPARTFTTPLSQATKFNPDSGYGSNTTPIFTADQISMFENKGINNLEEILNLPIADLRTMAASGVTKPEKRIKHYLTEVLPIGTDGLLIEKLNMDHAYPELHPISSVSDNLRREELDRAIDLVWKRSDDETRKKLHSYLDRHGYFTGHVATLSSMSTPQNVTRERIRQVEANVKSILKRSTKHGINLDQFRTYSHDSFPFKMGYNCLSDIKIKLPQVAIESSTLGQLISRESLKKITDRRVWSAFYNKELTGETTIPELFLYFKPDILPAEIAEEVFRNFSSLEVAQQRRDSPRERIL